MIVLLLLLGILIGLILGAAGAAAALGPNRERLRDELKSISADVLAQTGESLAQRLAEQRRAEEQRAAGRDGPARGGAQAAGRAGAGEARRRSRARSAASSASAARRRSSSSEMVRTLTHGTDTLRKETGELVSALKRPATRGSWGEIQLRNVVEMAGMVAHCDFVEQSTIHTEDGRLRPDMLVRLPGGKLIVVDSKVPLDAYLSALEASADDERRRAARRAPRQADARPHHQARVEGLPAAVRLHARVRRDVRALRRHLPGRARGTTRR